MDHRSQVAQTEELRDRAHRKRRDVATVISILPYPLDERKPGLVPGQFNMPAAKKNDMELLVIERCIHAVYLDETRPRLIVPDPSDVVAESIVLDHKRSIHGYIPGIAEPGIEWIDGEFPNDIDGKKAIAGMHASLLKSMIERQRKWFEYLVQFADDDWAKFKMHKFITKLQRDACMELGLDREWITATEIEMAASKCRFCFSMVHPDAIVCAACNGVLDIKKYEANFIKAGSPVPEIIGQKRPTT